MVRFEKQPKLEAWNGSVYVITALPGPAPYHPNPALPSRTLLVHPHPQAPFPPGHEVLPKISPHTNPVSFPPFSYLSICLSVSFTRSPFVAATRLERNAVLPLAERWRLARRGRQSQSER